MPLYLPSNLFRYLSTFSLLGVPLSITSTMSLLAYTVPLLSYLWCHKVGGVTGSEKEAIASPKLLGESKVTDPDGVRIPRVVHIQDITGLQVSVHNLRTETRRFSHLPTYLLTLILEFLWPT